MNGPAIRAEGLVKRFGAVTALDGADLLVRPGSVLGLLGPNGAGKTTAVRILATLIRPDAGWCEVGGHDVLRAPHRVRELIGLTGQYAAVDEELTGTENVVLVARLLELSRAEARRRAAELLDRFGLSDVAGRRARTYSGGLRRRLDLAVSMVGRPEVLFLDEPTTGLDAHARNDVWDVVRKLVADGATVLLTTQYLDEADRLADEVVVLDAGRVVASGTPAELKAMVGAQRLEIRPELASDLPRVASLVRRATGAVPVDDGGLVRVGVAGSFVLSSVVRELDEAGIPVRELSLRLPSMDEAFLALTGGAARR